MVRASRSMTEELLASSGRYPNDPDCCTAHGVLDRLIEFETDLD